MILFTSALILVAPIAGLIGLACQAGQIRPETFETDTNQ
jgi:hypothetical protein